MTTLAALSPMQRGFSFYLIAPVIGTDFSGLSQSLFGCAAWAVEKSTTSATILQPNHGPVYSLTMMREQTRPAGPSASSPVRQGRKTPANDIQRPAGPTGTRPSLGGIGNGIKSLWPRSQVSIAPYTAALSVAIVSIAATLLLPGRGHHRGNRLDRPILLAVNGDRERIDC